MRGLEAFEAELRRDLSLLDYPRRDWMPQRATADGRPVLDVLVVGAGQGGLATAASLMRERVRNILVVDENPPDRAGPWLNFARMVTLRTPKYLTGPDLGIPRLTIQAWYEAQHGTGAWEALGLVPKEIWAEYLAWLRRVLEIPVQAHSRVVAIEWSPTHGSLRASIEREGSTSDVFARRIVLATGIEGSGAWHVPSFIREALPEHLYAHTRDSIDFEALRGKRVGVLGAGASAFDNAAVALEHDATEVRLFFRRDRLVDVNPYRWAEFVGFLKHHGDLCDADRWRFIRQIVRMGQLPPRDTLERARKHAGFHMHPSSPWEKVECRGEVIQVTTPSGTHEFDFVIVATGFVTDLSARAELSAIWPEVVLWSDRHTPPDEDRHADLERHPYLGPSFELLPRDPGRTPWVSHIYNYTFGCLVSLGFGGASISGMKYSLRRLVDGITRSFFVEDAEHHFETLRAYDVKEY
jgi:FAD-dependent urate hydroxylase